MSPDGAAGPAPSSPFLTALREPDPLWTVELRPPPAGLDRHRSVDAWIDLRQGVRSLLRDDRFVLFTDDAVGDREEESVQHLTSNLGPNEDLSRVVPFLTCKHSLEYCRLFARRAVSYGLGAVTVTGGDREVGAPRCVPRSRDLRRIIREEFPDLPLGSWVNPYRDPVEQAELLLDPDHHSDYYLTQVVSHHDLAPLERFLEEVERRGVDMPGLVGVFFYRSANATTLRRLRDFIPVPEAGLIGEFEAGLSAEDICARTLRTLSDHGVRKTYISNLDPRRAPGRLRIVERLAS